MSASPPAHSQGRPAPCPGPGLRATPGSEPWAVLAPSAQVWTRVAPGLSQVLAWVLMARGSVAVLGAFEEMAWSVLGTEAAVRAAVV